MTANLFPQGRRCIGLLTSLRALVAAALASSLANSAEDRKPPFEFASPASLDIAWKATDHGEKTATVVNNTTSPLTLGVTLSTLEIKDTSSKPLDNASVLRLTANGRPLELGAPTAACPSSPPPAPARRRTRPSSEG